MKEMKDVEPVNEQNELMNGIVQLLQNGNADDGDKEEISTSTSTITKHTNGFGLDTIQGTSSDIITSDELLLSNGHRILEYSYSDSEEVYELDQQNEEAQAETSISARSAKTDNWKLEWKNSIGNFIDGLQKYSAAVNKDQDQVSSGDCSHQLIPGEMIDKEKAMAPCGSFIPDYSIQMETEAQLERVLRSKRVGEDQPLKYLVELSVKPIWISEAEMKERFPMLLDRYEQEGNVRSDTDFDSNHEPSRDIEFGKNDKKTRKFPLSAALFGRRPQQAATSSIDNSMNAKKTPSPIWRFFTELDGGQRVECLHCKAVVSIVGRHTRSLWRHMNKCQPVVSKQARIEHDMWLSRHQFSPIWEFYNRPATAGEKVQCRCCDNLVGSKNLWNHLKIHHKVEYKRADESRQRQNSLVKSTKNTSRSADEDNDGDYADDMDTQLQEVVEEAKSISADEKAFQCLDAEQRVWHYFKKLPQSDTGGQNAQCLCCLRIISIVNNQNEALWKHLMRRHPVEHEAAKTGKKNQQKAVTDPSGLNATISELFGHRRPSSNRDSNRTAQISPIWKFFKKLADQTRAECLCCKTLKPAVFSIIHRSTGTLWTHLMDHHPMEYQEAHSARVGPNRKVAPFSPVWEFFDRLAEERKARCRCCDTHLSIKSRSTESLWHHLKSFHPAEHKIAQHKRQHPPNNTTNASGESSKTLETLKFPSSEGDAQKDLHAEGKEETETTSNFHKEADGMERMMVNGDLRDENGSETQHIGDVKLELKPESGDGNEDRECTNEDNEDEEPEYEVEIVLARRKVNKNLWKYQVKWLGYDEVTWEPAANVQHLNIVKEFDAAEEAKLTENNMELGASSRPSLGKRRRVWADNGDGDGTRRRSARLCGGTKAAEGEGNEAAKPATDANDNDTTFDATEPSESNNGNCDVKCENLLAEN